MSGVDFLADTNAIIYLLAGNNCMRPFLNKGLGVSIISVMELLSYPGITEQEEKSIRSFLEQCNVFQITDDVKEKTISTRKQYRIKLPDSIIAATAFIHKLPLITADTDMNKIEGLQIEKITPLSFE